MSRPWAGYEQARKDPRWRWACERAFLVKTPSMTADEALIIRQRGVQDMFAIEVEYEAAA